MPSHRSLVACDTVHAHGGPNMAPVLGPVINDLRDEERGRPRIRYIVVLVVKTGLERIAVNRGDESNQRISRSSACARTAVLLLSGER